MFKLIADVYYIDLGLEDNEYDELKLQVSGNLEKKSTLKVTLHLDIEIVEDETTLKTGDTIWLTFSERAFYIEGRLPQNAIQMGLSKVLDHINNQYMNEIMRITSTEEEDLVASALFRQ